MERTLLPCAANWLFTCLLQGLQIHGQHEACMAWHIQRTFQHYEILVSIRFVVFMHKQQTFENFSSISHQINCERLFIFQIK